MPMHFRPACALALLASIAPCVRAQSSSLQPIAPVTAATASLVNFSSSRDGMDAPAPVPGGGITRGTPAPSGSYSGPLSRIAVGGYISPLGAGGGIAVAVAPFANVRAGLNYFGYSLTGTDDGANYSGNLHFRSLQAGVDLFPFRRSSFHVTPGFLFNNQNRVTAFGGIEGGQSFTLNDVNYYSSTTDPVTGNGSVTFKKTAPMLTVGWGNWVSRREHKHISFPIEVGFAHTGDAAVALNLKGTVCNEPADINCGQIATDPSVQANINGQIAKLQKDLQWIRFYPILSTGVALKF
jgi:hypothetical protein